MFWSAWSEVFEEPEDSTLCGCHVHVSPSPQQEFSLSQLRRIAFGVVRYEPLVAELLPAHRNDNKYCRLNTEKSEELHQIMSHTPRGMDLIAVKHRLDQVADKYQLRNLMQQSYEPKKDRYVLWNFDNARPGKSGSVEFRGGPGIRDSEQTKTWVSFVVAFIHLCLSQVCICLLYHLSQYDPEMYLRSHRMSSFIPWSPITQPWPVFGDVYARPARLQA